MKNIFHKLLLPSDNVSLATYYFLRQLNVNVSITSVENELHSHPDYPTLLSIKESLQKWKVETNAFRTSEDKLKDLPTPFIAYTRGDEGRFLVIEKVEDENILYINDDGQMATYTKEAFLSIWNSIILLAQPLPDAGEPDYKKIVWKEKWASLSVPLIIVALIAAGCLKILLSQVDIYFILMTITNAAGVVVSFMLLYYEYDSFNPLLKKICSPGRKTNCNAILSSKAAKVLGNISWSDIGFVYFNGIYLFGIFVGNQAAQLILILNLLSLPYIFFSVYYQARIVRQWCLLCLLVQFIFFTGFIIAFATGKLTTLNRINLDQIWALGLTTSFSAISLFFLKNQMYSKRKNKELKYQLARLKTNEFVFNSLLQQQPQIHQVPEGLGITIGNVSASNTIIKVCNPYCTPCAEAHSVIDELLRHNENLKVQIIFTATNYERDFRAKPVKHFLALHEKDSDNLTDILNAWYRAEKKEYKVFANKYPMDEELNMQDGKVEAMADWCTQANIKFTPTFFFNGFLLPDAYSIGDFRYLLRNS